MERLPVAVMVGTRPEAVKLAPVVLALRRSKRLRPVLVGTSQHGRLARQALEDFGLTLDADLKVMRSNQTLWSLSSRLLARVGAWLDQARPAAVLVQGDTTTALMGGLAAFYHQIPVGHVEAGLRTDNLLAPFPEELNRTLLTRLARWHFAPTRRAARRLRAEGVRASHVFQTGNTIVDALRLMLPRAHRHAVKDLVAPAYWKSRLLLVTCHRREHFGRPLRSIAEGLARVARAHPEVALLFPVHPNPAVRETVAPVLGRLANVFLCPPLDYRRFLGCLQRAYLVLSDSGGVQEEATALGKPVLVLRKETERPEGLETGPLKLVGTSASRIARECDGLLDDSAAYRRLARVSSAFGDGQAARRIVDVLERSLGTGTALPRGK